MAKLGFLTGTTVSGFLTGTVVLGFLTGTVVDHPLGCAQPCKRWGTALWHPLRATVPWGDSIAWEGDTHPA